MPRNDYVKWEDRIGLFEHAWVGVFCSRQEHLPLVQLDSMLLVRLYSSGC